MEFSEFEKRRIEKFVDAFLEKRRPPPDLGKQLAWASALKGRACCCLRKGRPERTRHDSAGMRTEIVFE